MHPAVPSPAPALPALPSTVFDWTRLSAVPTRAGECRALFDSATATLARLECHATTLRRGERAHEPHRHADEELVFVREGELEVTLNERTETVAAGGVLFFASMDLHGIRNSGAGPATYFVLRIFPRDLPA